MEVLHALVAQNVQKAFEKTAVVLCRSEAPLRAGVDVPEVDAGREDGVDSRKRRDLLGRADLRELAHRLGAEHHVLHPVEVDVVAQYFQPVDAAHDGDGALVFPLRRGVEDDALPPHQPQHFGAVEDVAEGLLRHLVVGVRKIDEVGRMDGELDALLCKGAANGARLLRAHAHAAAEGIFEAVETALSAVARRLFGVLVAFLIKAFGIAARAEFDHIISPLLRRRVRAPPCGRLRAAFQAPLCFGIFGRGAAV